MKKNNKINFSMLWGNRKMRGIFSWVLQICLVLIAAGILAIGFGRSIVMQESSMEPTLSAGDHYLINQLAYRIGSPKRGDIVVFQNSEGDSGVHIKRIIGLPGETVQIRDGMIMIDGDTYMEKKDFPVISDPGLAQDEITLELGEYFVLGDNRNNSVDSRYSEIGRVRKKDIIGRLWFVVSPRSKFGFLNS